MRALLLLFVACSHAAPLPVAHPVDGVPPSVWQAPALTSTWWLRPAQLCLHGDDYRPVWVGTEWRCP